MLFYSVLALIESQEKINCLHGEHMSSLVRSAANLLTKHASDFNQHQVIKSLKSGVSFRQILLCARSSPWHVIATFELCLSLSTGSCAIFTENNTNDK
jgi:hypothetical protein